MSAFLPEDKEEELDKSIGFEELKNEEPSKGNQHQRIELHPVGSKTPAFSRSLVPEAAVAT